MLSSGTSLKKILFATALIGVSFLLYLRHQQIEEAGTLRWFDRPIIFVTAPVVKALTSVRDGVSGAYGRYFHLVDVEKDNEALRAENVRLKERGVVLSDLESENLRLTSLLNLRAQLTGKTVAARVTGFPPLSPYRIITIDKGSNDGIRRRAPVVAADGLVGQVSRVYPGTSQVLLITDPTSAVDGRIEPSGARGLVVGKSLKLGLKRDLYISAFEYLSQSVDIAEGTPVSTSGMDGVYPAGIPIGTVHAREKKKYDIFQQAEVIPSVDFFKLKEVLVIP
jgi:rod shape-determining protein MreC